MTRYEYARQVISQVHAGLPDSCPLDERRKVVDASYPFGERAYSPYKAWLRARREYLTRYGHQPRNTPHESPMERMMRRAQPIGEN